jgi:hypothetical protein
MPALLLLIRMTTKDVIVPTWRLQTVSKSGGKSQQASPAHIRIVRKDREVVNQEQITLAFKAFASFLHPDSNKGSALRLAVAARRIMNAYSEIDLIDRFCDLWEACEILCPKKHGKIDYRIAKRVAGFTGFDQHRLKTKIISKLYRLRKDIVHSFTEDKEALSANLLMMFDIATLLYASYFGFSYSREGALADACRQENSRPTPIASEWMRSEEPPQAPDYLPEPSDLPDFPVRRRRLSVRNRLSCMAGHSRAAADALSVPLPHCSPKGQIDGELV